MNLEYKNASKQGDNMWVLDPTVLKALVVGEVLAKLHNADLLKELETIFNVVTYKRKSLNTGRIYTNVAGCKLDIIKSVIAGKPVRDLYNGKKGKYARVTVWRYKKELLRSGIISEVNGALVLNPEKFPSFSLFRLIRDFEAKVPK